jgi:hypothetical protein
MKCYRNSVSLAKTPETTHGDAMHHDLPKAPYLLPDRQKQPTGMNSSQPFKYHMINAAFNHLSLVLGQLRFLKAEVMAILEHRRDFFDAARR